MRVAFVTMPGVYADIMSASLAKRTDVAIVGSLSTRHDLTAEIERLAPDVVFIGLSENEGEADVGQALRACRDGCVIALAFDGRSATLHFLRPHRIAFGAAHPDHITSAILDRHLHPKD
ncbi:hypothetical protein [Bradyrhizobium liaoningense]|uniref:hypothetical protein n=1 Tax=Bradyrhizobium liaoningense TaxID=43992 RepID=UPI001BA525FB|nr:hypothetical protein [Bradyrhizobium liaoningense]MBR0820236.1 hypothetical protein [Bradyrhizobium liaoningense]